MIRRFTFNRNQNTVPAQETTSKPLQIDEMPHTNVEEFDWMEWVLDTNIANHTTKVAKAISSDDLKVVELPAKTPDGTGANQEFIIRLYGAVFDSRVSYSRISTQCLEERSYALSY